MRGKGSRFAVCPVDDRYLQSPILLAKIKADGVLISALGSHIECGAAGKRAFPRTSLAGRIFSLQPTYRMKPSIPGFEQRSDPIQVAVRAAGNIP